MHPARSITRVVVLIALRREVDLDIKAKFRQDKYLQLIQDGKIDSGSLRRQIRRTFPRAAQYSERAFIRLKEYRLIAKEIVRFNHYGDKTPIGEYVQSELFKRLKIKAGKEDLGFYLLDAESGSIDHSNGFSIEFIRLHEDGFFEQLHDDIRENYPELANAIPGIGFKSDDTVITTDQTAKSLARIFHHCL